MDRRRSGLISGGSGSEPCAGPEIGVGLCDVDRIARLYGKHGERFLRTCFSDDEIAACLAAARPEVHLAGRWAAKRALGSALRRLGLEASESEVSVAAGEDGAPCFRFSPDLARRLPRGLPGRLSLSLSHTVGTAVAIVVLGGSS